MTKPPTIDELRKINQELGEPKTLQWAARELHVSIWTVRRYIKEDKLRAFTPNGKSIRVWERSVYELKFGAKINGIEPEDMNNPPAELDDNQDQTIKGRKRRMISKGISKE